MRSTPAALNLPAAAPRSRRRWRRWSGRSLRRPASSHSPRPPGPTTDGVEPRRFVLPRSARRPWRRSRNPSCRARRPRPSWRESRSSRVGRRSRARGRRTSTSGARAWRRRASGCWRPCSTAGAVVALAEQHHGEDLVVLGEGRAERALGGAASPWSCRTPGTTGSTLRPAIPPSALIESTKASPGPWRRPGRRMMNRRSACPSGRARRSRS